MSQQQLIQRMIEIGQACDRHGWVPATGGNFSARVDAETALVTRSGVHKGYLNADDFLCVNMQGQAKNSKYRPSAETLLHCERYQSSADVGAVLHGHSIASTLMPADYGELVLSGYELLKIFAGIDSHQAEIRIPVLANSQDMPKLAAKVRAAKPAHAYIIAGHGVYVWGQNLDQCFHRLEALEFLLQCEWQKTAWKKA